LDQYSRSIDRLEQLIERNLVPVKRGRDGSIIFLRQVIIELEHYGVKQLSLRGLADAIPGAEFGKFLHGRVVVKCDTQNLSLFLDG
jgi:hypothetical protein